MTPGGQVPPALLPRRRAGQFGECGTAWRRLVVLLLAGTLAVVSADLPNVAGVRAWLVLAAGQAVP